jgi:DNA-binding GntR family transcriptional regulator
MHKKFRKKLKKIPSRGNLAEMAYQILKEAITRGYYPPGTWLPEDELTKELGISRTPIREALNRLQGDGLIEVTPRKGARLIEFTYEQIEELLEAREALETTFFVQSARQIDPSEFKSFKNRFIEAEKEVSSAEGDWDLLFEKQNGYIELDRAFHDRLIAACGNRYWIKFYHSLRNLIQVSAYRAGRHPMQYQRAVSEHHAILNALLNKDYEDAKEFLAKHIQNYKKHLLDSIRSL